MALFDIILNLAANTAALETGLKRAEDRIDQFAGAVKSGLEFAGVTLSLAALSDALVKSAESGEQLVQLSERMGTTVTSLSQLQYAAQATNVPFQTLTGSMDILSRNLVQASEGSGKAKAAIADLGIDAGKLAALPLDKQLGVIADKIAALPNPTQQTAAAMRIFGSAGADLLPILRQGASGIDDLRAKSDALGATMSDVSAQQLAAANVALTNLSAASRGLWTELTVDLAPALTTTVGWFTQLASSAHGAIAALSAPANDQQQLVAYQRQAQQLAGQLANLSEQASHFLSGRANVQVNGVSDQLDAVNRQIEALQKKMADASPQKPAGDVSEDNSDLAELYYNRNGHLADDFYNKLQLLGETDEKRQADEWTVKIQAAENYYVTSTESAQDFATKIQEINDSYLQPIGDHFKTIGKVVKTTFDDMQKYANTAGQSIQASFATFLSDPTLSAFKKLGEAWLQTLDKMAADAATSAIFQALFGTPGTTGALGTGGLGQILGALFGVSSNASAASSAAAALPYTDIDFGALFGFANGGSFDVGGAGGTDSQMVAFKATPGEHVQVGGGGASSPITIQNYVTVTSPQVTKNDVLGAMQQTQTSTISKLQDMKRRKKF